MTRHPRSRFVRILAPLAALSLVAAACGDDDDDDTADTTDATESTDMTDTTDDMTDTTDDMADDGETIVDIAVGNPDLSTLVTALETAELVDTLAGEGPFTVFAPTNDGFDTAVDDLGVPLDEFLVDQEFLETVLLTHVIEGETIMSSDIEDGATLTSMSGTELEFAVADDSVMVNGIEVTTADVEASNGVVHVISGAIIPDE